MKVGIISDIHANLPALEAIVNEDKNNNIEKWLFLGDLVGYYYWPAECMQILKSCSAICISGNHDRMLSEVLKGNSILRNSIASKYGSSINKAIEVLTEDEIEWLISLPKDKEISIDGYSVLLCHGSPWDMDFYVYPDSDYSVRNRMKETEHDLVLFGHTHYPVVWSEQGTLVVNPGSVGQPRDGTPGACWAVWDTNDNSIHLKRESYEYEVVIDACRMYDPDITYLQNILKRRK